MKKRLDDLSPVSVMHAAPVVLVSTRSRDNVDNVSPYGMNMAISFSPPMFAIGVHPNRDTYRNIVDSGEFAVNMLTPELKNACIETARKIPPEESEFDLAGLTRRPAGEINVALVGESPACFECRLEWMKEAGDHSVVVGGVVASWVEEEMSDNDPVRMRLNYGNLYHIGPHYFTRSGVLK